MTDKERAAVCCMKLYENGPVKDSTREKEV